MKLEPCVACRRHVAITEPACPFCREPLALASSRSTTFGRMSRAAVFAGAALATTACGKKAKQPAPTSNTSTSTQQQQEQQVEAPPDAPTPAPVIVPVHPEPMPYGAPPARRRYV